MRTAILHIDGTDYELQRGYASVDDEAFQRLQEQVSHVLRQPEQPEGRTWGSAELVAGLSPEMMHFPVRRRGADFDLMVASGSAGVVAVYLLQPSRTALDLDDVEAPSTRAQATTDEGARWTSKEPWTSTSS